MQYCLESVIKTKDGYVLKEGDSCWVCVQDPMGWRNVSFKPRKAIYRDEIALENGWDFHILNLRVECEVEVVHVWKNKPEKEKIK